MVWATCRVWVTYAVLVQRSQKCPNTAVPTVQWNTRKDFPWQAGCQDERSTAGKEKIDLYGAEAGITKPCCWAQLIRSIWLQNSLFLGDTRNWWRRGRLIGHKAVHSQSGAQEEVQPVQNKWRRNRPFWLFSVSSNLLCCKYIALKRKYEWN